MKGWKDILLVASHRIAYRSVNKNLKTSAECGLLSCPDPHCHDLDSMSTLESSSAISRLIAVTILRSM